MLDIVERHLPLGSDHWDAVQVDYNTTSPARQDWVARDVDSIRRKFKSLRNHRKPTGDPECPPTVVRAKRLNRMIKGRMAVVEFDDDFLSQHPLTITVRPTPSPMLTIPRSMTPTTPSKIQA